MPHQPSLHRVLCDASPAVSARSAVLCLTGPLCRECYAGLPEEAEADPDFQWLCDPCHEGLHHCCRWLQPVVFPFPFHKHFTASQGSVWQPRGALPMQLRHVTAKGSPPHAAETCDSREPSPCSWDVEGGPSAYTDRQMFICGRLWLPAVAQIRP